MSRWIFLVECIFHLRPCVVCKSSSFFKLVKVGHNLGTLHNYLITRENKSTFYIYKKKDKLYIAFFPSKEKSLENYKVLYLFPSTNPYLNLLYEIMY